MSEIINNHRFTKIFDLAIIDLESFISEELRTLYLDFGQKIDEVQALHEAKRLKELLTSYKYRNWVVGDVHTALSNIVNGTVGDYKRLNFRAICAALEKAFEIKAAEKRYKNDIPRVDVDRNECRQSSAYWAPYIEWWLKYNVDPKSVTVDDYNQAKSSGQLDSLTTLWAGSRTPGPLSETLKSK